ncbi:MSHA biogenesis protein MshI [Thiohalospira halophila DSM 15071]|uniref:MSHA biogenesis protein MshI n=1 Tax=Thiohalospira halophila DSM 15071 TaxID=1123397 RepID=A0A1I1N8D7_9GAMM|nr:PilN domain-containing protein [Thiohalospira halophila]SFC93715.1 MSHA biogenesis protein MshI [Thiohalospira halophila DSM 15071]
MSRLRFLEALKRRLHRQPRHEGRTGVFLGEDTFSLAAVDETGENLVACAAGDFAEESPSAALGREVERLGLGGSPAVAVLDDGAYQLLHLEAPEVPPEEMADALRWRLGDLVDFPPEEAVIATLPQHSDRGASRMVFAFVVHRPVVQRVIDTIASAGLQPEAVEVRESALRNLTARIPDEAGGTATLHLCREDGVILLTHDQGLYLARRLEAGTGRLAEGSTLEMEGIALELQRSLDYYERQLASAPAARALIAPTPMDRGPLIDYINTNLNIAASALELSHVLNIECEAEAETLSRATLAAGGALRAETGETIDLHTGHRQQRDYLAPRALAAALLLWLIVLTGLSGTLGWQAHRAEAQAVAVEAELNALRERRDELNQRLEAREVDPELEAELERARTELAGQKRFREALDDLEGMGHGGFSPLLTGLADAPPRGLWLRRFVLAGEGAARFEGSATAAEQVPAFVEGLAASGAFTASRFARMDLQRREDGDYLDFHLVSRSLLTEAERDADGEGAP